MADEPHPQVLELLDQMTKQQIPPLYTLPLEEAREVYRELLTHDGDPEAVGGVENTTVDTACREVPVRIYTPDGKGPFPVLVFFHGGGWILGSVDTHDSLCRALVAESDVMVVSVEYALSPENRFPRALEDCYAVTLWARDHAERLGARPNRIAVGGDSSGGNLAAAVCLMARDRNEFEPSYQVLLYPALNHSFDTPSYEENARGYFLTRNDMKRFWDLYLPDPNDGKHPYASPSRSVELSDLPPTLVVTCGYDPLRDEGQTYAEKLERAGVPVDTIHYDDMIHGFMNMLVEPQLDRARESIRAIGTRLRQQLSG